MWNHYDTIGNGPKTNNNLEGYNSRLRKFIGSANPNIFKAITVLQNEDLNASVKYHRVEKEEDETPRNKLSLGNDEMLNTFKKMFQKDEITLQVFINRIIEMNSLERTEKRIKKEKNKVKDSDSSEEEVSDSEVSDSEGNDDEEIDSDDSIE